MKNNTSQYTKQRIIFSILITTLFCITTVVLSSVEPSTVREDIAKNTRTRKIPSLQNLITSKMALHMHPQYIINRINEYLNTNQLDDANQLLKNAANKLDTAIDYLTALHLSRDSLHAQVNDTFINLIISLDVIAAQQPDEQRQQINSKITHLIEMLVNAGISFNNPRGALLLNRAIRWGDSQLALLLLQTKAVDPNLKHPKWKIDALTNAVISANLPIVQYLLTHGEIKSPDWPKLLEAAQSQIETAPPDDTARIYQTHRIYELISNAATQAQTTSQSTGQASSADQE